MSQKQVSFKPCKTGDGFLFPPHLGDLIPANHPVRLINAMVDKLDITDILMSYKGGGTSSYHPRMLIKLLIYGYFDGVTSSRKLEQSTRENICYMWLCGLNTPTYATISTFRSGKLRGKVKHLFGIILKQIYEQEQLQLGTQFIDGTIFESVANKNTYIWRKNTERYKSQTEAKIKAILADIEEYLKEDEQEDAESPKQQNELPPKEQSPEEVSGSPKKQVETASDCEAQTSNEDKPQKEPIDSGYVKEKIDEFRKKNDEEVDKKAKKLVKELLPNLLKYEEQEKILNGRNSYSKTDHDATFMRMKGDRKGKAKPKPAYNAQLSTSNQFILNYTLHQNSNDATCYIKHMLDNLQLVEKYDLPGIEASVGDGIYGTQQNYDFIEEQGIENYLKYPSFNDDLKRKNNKKVKNKLSVFHPSKLHYNEEQDFYVCPMGQRMHKVGQQTVERKNGYEVTLDIYQNTRCETCPLRGVCHKGAGVRKVQRNSKLEKYRKEAFNNLTSEKGDLLRRQRSVDVEPVFGHMKFNRQWDRFTLNGKEKVEIELGLQSIGHNLRKWVKMRLKKARFADFGHLIYIEHAQISHAKISKKQKSQIINLPQNLARTAA